MSWFPFFHSFLPDYVVISKYTFSVFERSSITACTVCNSTADFNSSVPCCGWLSFCDNNDRRHEGTAICQHLALFTTAGRHDATRPSIVASRREHSLSILDSVFMAKRRAVIDSDDEQDGREESPSGAKRSRLNNKDQGSSKSKGKGKARDDNDLLNDIRVDDDDDIAAMRDTHAEEDEGFQERFEEEHEESIRESIRQRNKHQGVRSTLCLATPSSDTLG